MGRDSIEIYAAMAYRHGQNDSQPCARQQLRCRAATRLCLASLPLFSRGIGLHLSQSSVSPINAGLYHDIWAISVDDAYFLSLYHRPRRYFAMLFHIFSACKPISPLSRQRQHTDMLIAGFR